MPKYKAKLAFKQRGLSKSFLHWKVGKQSNASEHLESNFRTKKIYWETRHQHVAVSGNCWGLNSWGGHTVLYMLFFLPLIRTIGHNYWNSVDCVHFPFKDLRKVDTVILGLIFCNLLDNCNDQKTQDDLWLEYSCCFLQQTRSEGTSLWYRSLWTLWGGHQLRQEPVDETWPRLRPIWR